MADDIKPRLRIPATAKKGEVVEINTRLNDEPALVNSDPYGDGWIFAVEVADPSALDGLMDAAAYRALVEG